MRPATLSLPDLSERAFFDLCQEFPDDTLESDPDGSVTLLPLVDIPSAVRHANFVCELVAWATTYHGYVVGPRTTFLLPDGSRRSPGAAWFDENRWKQARTPATLFPTFAPDFVTEFDHHDLPPGTLQRKMQLYLGGGVQLGWLLDFPNRTVTIYRPGIEPSTLNNPTEVTGDGPVAGFVLPMAEIF